VLHTVNVRLSAEQILYTINHAEDDVILINSELLPLLEQVWDRVDAGKKLVLLSDGDVYRAVALWCIRLAAKLRAIRTLFIDLRGAIQFRVETFELIGQLLNSIRCFRSSPRFYLVPQIICYII
jgi:hypothetical protein